MIFLQFGDDSKDIKVGTLIALIAEPGEDWKTVSTMNPSSSNNEPEVVSKTVAANSTAVTQTQSERQVTQRPTYALSLQLRRKNRIFLSISV